MVQLRQHVCSSGKAIALPEMSIIQPSLSLARSGVNIAAHFPPFSATSIRARDVIIIHPFHVNLDPDTGEKSNPCPLNDHIAAIALDQSCRVTFIPIAMQDGDARMHEHQNLSLQGESHDISCLQQPIFIVIPSGPIPHEALKQQIDLICDTHQFPRQDLIVIEPADAPASNNGQQLISELGKSGFKRISAHQLDSSNLDNPDWLLDKVSINVHQESFEAHLTKLLDSFNLSVSKHTNYQLELIDSSARGFLMPTFLQCMLANRHNADMDSNFILIWPQLTSDILATVMDLLKTPSCSEVLPAAVIDLLEMPSWISKHSGMFSRLKVFFAYPDKKHLQQIIDISGSGQHNINIVFASCQHEQLRSSIRHLFPASIQARYPNTMLHLARPIRRPSYDETSR